MSSEHKRPREDGEDDEPPAKRFKTVTHVDDRSYVDQEIARILASRPSWSVGLSNPPDRAILRTVLTDCESLLVLRDMSRPDCSLYTFCILFDRLTQLCGMRLLPYIAALNSDLCISIPYRRSMRGELVFLSECLTAAQFTEYETKAQARGIQPRHHFSQLTREPIGYMTDCIRNATSTSSYGSFFMPEYTGLQIHDLLEVSYKQSLVHACAAAIGISGGFTDHEVRKKLSFFLAQTMLGPISMLALTGLYNAVGEAGPALSCVEIRTLTVERIMEPVVLKDLLPVWLPTDIINLMDDYGDHRIVPHECVLTYGEQEILLRLRSCGLKPACVVSQSKGWEICVQPLFYTV